MDGKSVSVIRPAYIYFAKANSGYIVPTSRFSDDTSNQEVPGFSKVTSTSQVASTVRTMSANDVTICSGKVSSI